MSGLAGLLATAQTPAAHVHAESEVTNLVADLASKAPNASYRTLMVSSSSHIAGVTAGTHSMDAGSPGTKTGVGVLIPPQIINIVAADYPSVGGVAPVLRIRASLNVNDVAPTGNYTFGLFPITRPGVSGGAGVCIYTLGAVVPGSNGATFTAPAADGSLSAVSVDFALPADGQYVLGYVTTATVANNSLVHLVAHLQMRNA